MADVCTSLMAEWKSLTQHEMGWYVPARGLRAGLSQQLFLRERWSECLPACPAPVVLRDSDCWLSPQSAVLRDLFGSDMSHLVARH